MSLPRLRTSLRTRLLIALLATSALTLLVAALALLGPLQDQLREQSAQNLEAAVLSSRPQFERAVVQALRETRRDPPDIRRTRLLLKVRNPALDLRRRTDSRVLVSDAVPNLDDPIYDTDADLAPPRRAAYRALALGGAQRLVSSEDAVVAVRLLPSRRQPYLLIVQKPLRDVSDAVAQVRRAFAAAAGVGLIVALLLGAALATTLSRRLARLRRSALRVAQEGPDAPVPRDQGSDEVGDLARTLAAMQHALRRQEEARRAFVATASHELRTPLTSLQGTLELLGEDLADDRLDLADARDQVARAQGDMRRLTRLASELLDLSRLDAAVELRSEPVELGELCRAVAAEFALRARDHDVVLRVLPPPGPCWARGDPGAVARVVRILLDNALRYSPTGAAVAVGAAYHGDRATIEVADRGPGVPRHEREIIFERFRRGSASPGEGGFGLGLAIGHELARRMDGELALTDPDDSPPGARFRLSLPIELPAGSAAPSDAAPRPVAR